MKTFAVFLGFLAVITAILIPQTDAKVFKRVKKGAGEAKIQLPEGAAEAQPILDCFEATRKLKKQCIEIMRRDFGEEMTKCETGAAQTHDHAKEAVKKMHEGLEKCLKEEYAAAATASTMRARKRRTAKSNATVDEQKAYANHQACWADLKPKYEECKSKVSGCEKFSKCTGMGTEPGVDEATWWRFNYMKSMREKKEMKVKKYLRSLVDCLHITVEGDDDGLGGLLAP